VIVPDLLFFPLVYLMRDSHEFTVTSHIIIARDCLIARNTQELAVHQVVKIISPV
jgi:hypothetical protein